MLGLSDRPRHVETAAAIAIVVALVRLDTGLVVAIVAGVVVPKEQWATQMLLPHLDYPEQQPFLLLP